jgi:mycothiol synthase
MPLVIRPQAPEDLDRLVEMVNKEAERPTTVEELEQREQERPKDQPWIALVAELDGAVVGRAEAGRSIWWHELDLFSKVFIDPDQRRKGIATNLYSALQPFFAEHQPRRIISTVKETQPEGILWATMHGFTKSHLTFESKLDLTQFDPAPFRAQVERVKASGIRFVPFTELQSPEAERRFYDLFNAYGDDTPDAADWRLMDFDEWRAWAIETNRYWPQGWLIAMDEGGEWAGYTMMDRNPVKPDHAHIYLTGVTRAFRGRGIALALKVLAAQVAREQGIKEVTTNNHSANGPMLAVNRRLGYVSLPGSYRLYKTYSVI